MGTKPAKNRGEAATIQTGARNSKDTAALKSTIPQLCTSKFGI